MPATGTQLRFGAVLALLEAATPAASPDGNATLTTDYVWRGSTHRRRPALQVGFRLSGDRGLYASAWGSSIRFAPELDAGIELDMTLGWSKPPSDDWAVDVNLLRYAYPRTRRSISTGPN